MSSLDATTFPDRPECFGLSGFTNVTCTIPSPSMIGFLNITNAKLYKQFYCLNPPRDSCAFGYCPNPDIASPAVRIATYAQSICFSIIILYSPNDIIGTLFAQLLATYSLLLSAAIAISESQLTRLHAIFAIGAAGSPLSFYLCVYAVRSTFSSKVHRMHEALGKGKILNRVLVVTMFPLWVYGLLVLHLPSERHRFQQVACDEVIQHHLIRKFFFGPFTLLMGRSAGEIFQFLSPLIALLVAWPVAIYLQRKEIWKKHNKLFPWARMWRKVVDQYPFIQFCTVIVFPSIYWVLTLEVDAKFTQEHFTPTYGQLLAIFAAIPAVTQAIQLIPRFIMWLNNLAFVRFVTLRPQTRSHQIPLPNPDDTHHRPQRPSAPSKPSAFSATSIDSNNTTWNYSMEQLHHPDKSPPLISPGSSSTMIPRAHYVRHNSDSSDSGGAKLQKKHYRRERERYEVSQGLGSGSSTSTFHGAVGLPSRALPHTPQLTDLQYAEKLYTEPWNFDEYGRYHGPGS